MALSEDSRSLLQLLLARGKSYGDIADLLGVPESEVRRRAHSALTELNGSDPDRRAEITDYLLGQADPISRAETAKALREDPEARETAVDLAAQLQLLVPGADLPKLDATAGSIGAGSPRRSGERSRAKSGAGREKSPPGFLSNLSIPQRRLLAILVLAAILIAIVIAVILVAGSGDDDAQDGEPAPTTAVLRPVDGEQGRGVVQFGFSGQNFAADLQFSNLEPSTQGQSYTLWLAGSGGAFPINQARVDDSGAIAGQVAINEAILCLIAGDFFTEMRLARADNDEVRRSVNQAAESGGEDASPESLPQFVGDTVLDGRISMPQDAKDEILRICNG